MQIPRDWLIRRQRCRVQPVGIPINSSLIKVKGFLSYNLARTRSTIMPKAKRCCCCCCCTATRPDLLCGYHYPPSRPTIWSASSALVYFDFLLWLTCVGYFSQPFPHLTLFFQEIIATGAPIKHTDGDVKYSYECLYTACQEEINFFFFPFPFVSGSLEYETYSCRREWSNDHTLLLLLFLRNYFFFCMCSVVWLEFRHFN